MSSIVGVNTEQHANHRNLFVATLMVIISCMAFGTVPFFAKSLSEAGVKSEYIPFYRYFISAVVFLPIVFRHKANYKSIFWGLVAGAACGLGWISYIEALKIVPVSTAGVIYMTYPIFTLLIAWIWQKQKPQIKAILASFIILIAALITMSDRVLTASHLSVLLYSFFAPFCFGLSIIILVNKLNDIPPMARVSCVGLGGITGLSFLIGLSGFESLVPANPHALYLAIGLALITATIPQLLYSTFTPVIGSAKAAVAGSVELPTMFLVGWLAFDETITMMQMLSGLLIIVAISITPSQRVVHRIPK